MSDGRRYSAVELPDGMRGWVIHWEPGEDTGWHDHGDSLAKIIVVRGVYVEYRFPMTNPRSRIEVGEWGVSHVSYRERHRVIPETGCTCIHIYTPALEYMNVYDSKGELVDRIPAEQELENVE